jgi:hypothetical protein
MTTAPALVHTTTGGSAQVDRLLEAILRGDGVPAELYSPSATLDATVPGWRFPVAGADAIARQLTSWFADPGTFEDLRRQPVEGGEVVTYLLTWEEHGVPHAAHHCHVLDVDADGRIAADMFFCGGRWDAALLAQMAAASDAG